MSEATPHSSPQSSPALSRRGFLIAGIAGASATAIPAAFPGAATARELQERTTTTATAAQTSSTLPLVQPISSKRAYRAFGVCSHPNFGTTVYQYTDAWMEALAKTGASYFRGMYAEGLRATKTTTAAARTYGIRWGMAVAPEDWSLTADELVRRIKHIAENAADVCLYVEGVNEPDHERSGKAPPSDWMQRTMNVQKTIWNTVRSDPRLDRVKVVGPSLHAVVATEDDYRRLGELGLPNYMDFAGLHRYPGGRYPDYLIDERLAWIEKHWAGRRTWITETGYTNSVAAQSGHEAVPEDISAKYAPSALLEAVDRDCKVCWYELLDDPDSGAKDVIESNFGMFGAVTMAPPWRPKPVVSSIRSLLDSLSDPGPGYTPQPIGLKIATACDDVRVTVVGRRDGTVTAYARRSKDSWDIRNDVRISVPAVPVTFTTARGSETVQVDDEVRAIRI